jgi:hypothetical protein
MMNLPRFMNIGTGVQTMLKLYLNNLNGCNDATTKERDL